MKLNLPHAARRLYTMDGEQITSMQQLLKPYYPELTYLRGLQNQIPVNTSPSPVVGKSFRKIFSKAFFFRV